MRGGALERGFAGAAAAYAIDHVRILRAHHPHHLGQQLGRILKVGVDDQDRFAAAQVQPRGQRQLVPVIARQIDRNQARVPFRQALHDAPAGVA